MKTQSQVESRIKYLRSLLHEYSIGYGKHLTEQEREKSITEIKNEINVLKWVISD